MITATEHMCLLECNTCTPVHCSGRICLKTRTITHPEACGCACFNCNKITVSLYPELRAPNQENFHGS